MTDQDPTTEPAPQRLEHFPITFFGMSMGLFGLALALKAGGFAGLAGAAGWLAGLALAGLLVLFALKALRFPKAVSAEWHHPVRLAFFPAISISLLLMATMLRDTSVNLANVIWIIGALAQAVLTLVVVSAWIGQRNFGTGHLSPAWFIPAVGNVVVPLAGVPLGHVEVSWYFMAVGLVFWLVLLTLIFNRLVFHDPLPGKLQPTLVILIAPPAVAFLSWTALQGGLDNGGRLLINIGYFFTLIVFAQAPTLLRLPFALSFWALSFPFAAMTVASFRFAELAQSPLHRDIGLILLILLVAIVATLIVQTARAAAAGKICQPEA
ncbi:MAG: SLAC1 anion channel family protein [Marinibacterium sp.]